MITVYGSGSQAYPLSLVEDVTFEKGVTVITGKNGAGKTSLFKKIASHEIHISSGEGNVYAFMLPHGSLIPNFGEGFDAFAYEQARELAVEAFVQRPHLFTKFVPDNVEATGIGGVGYSALYDISRSAMLETGKLVEGITPEDIRRNFKFSHGMALGSRNVEGLFNEYLKSNDALRYEAYEAFLSSGKDTISRDELMKAVKKDEPPWVLMNEILSRVLDNKYFFAPLDESLKLYNQRARFISVENNQEISVEKLSTGEQTIMWLVLSLFNAQFSTDSYRGLPRLLLLDEPDAFLHPQMVTRLYDILKFLAEKFDSAIVITTHSPTTVALAPGSIFKLANGVLVSQDKDSAIAELLDGVSQVSIDPENRRQVYVESGDDQTVYQLLFDLMRNFTPLINPKIFLCFLAAGPKVDDEHLRLCVKRSFGDVYSDELFQRFLDMVHSTGSCGQVCAAVKELAKVRNKTVRGIIDWDLRNNSKPGVTVSAHGYAYTLENVLLDPICILRMAHRADPSLYSIVNLCGGEVDQTTWLLDDGLVQESIDRFLRLVLGHEIEHSKRLEYLCGKNYGTDRRYLEMEGKLLKQKVLDAYPKLRKLDRDKAFLEEVTKSMVSFGWEYIPKIFAETFQSVQK